MISLMMYIPVVSHELPDWDVKDAGGEEGEAITHRSMARWPGGSQDFNVFSLGTMNLRIFSSIIGNVTTIIYGNMYTIMKTKGRSAWLAATKHCGLNFHFCIPCQYLYKY